MSSTTYRVSHLSDARQFATSLNIARRKTDPLDLSSDQTTLLVSKPTDTAGTIRATTSVTPLTGQGVELSHNGLTGASGIGSLIAYDRTSALWQEMNVGGSSIGLQVNGTTIATVDSASVNLASGMVLKVNSVQVVGARQAAIANAVNAAGSTPTQAEFNAFVTQFNAWLAAARTHGLIAT